MFDKEQQAHDFAISVLSDYLSKIDLDSETKQISNLLSDDPILFDVYYSSYYGFLYALKHQQKKNLKDHLTLLVHKIHSK